MGRRIYIVGAHSRACTLAQYIKYLEPDTVIKAFLVNNDEENPGYWNNIPVIHLDQPVQFDLSCPVYLGVRGVYHDALIAILKQMGFEDIIPVTVGLDMQFRNQYLIKYFNSIGRAFTKIEHLKCFSENVGGSRYGAASPAVYVVGTISDHILHKQYKLPFYAKYIQAGAALTEGRIEKTGILDSTGDSISYKNRQFCELTALYWMWKNAKEDIVGLEHFRRHFILPVDWQQRVAGYDIDAILPVPLYVAPSIEKNYKKRHIASDWEYMMDTLKRMHPEDYREAAEFFQGNLYSPCNMFIMRKNVLDEFCSWLFPILFAVAEHVGWRDDLYQNRYPGFLSERLMTFFFEKNRGRFNIVYADKNFLS